MKDVEIPFWNKVMDRLIRCTYPVCAVDQPVL